MSYDRDDLGYDLGYDSESLHIGNNPPQKIFKSKQNEIKYWMVGPTPPAPAEGASAASSAEESQEASKPGSFSISGDSVIFKSADGKKTKTVKTDDIAGLGNASKEFRVDLSSVTKAITKARKGEGAAAAAGKPKGDNYKPGQARATHLTGPNKPPTETPEAAKPKFEVERLLASTDPDVKNAAIKTEKLFGGDKKAASEYLSTYPPPDKNDKKFKNNPHARQQAWDKWNARFDYNASRIEGANKELGAAAEAEVHAGHNYREIEDQLSKAKTPAEKKTLDAKLAESKKKHDEAKSRLEQARTSRTKAVETIKQEVREDTAVQFLQTRMKQGASVKVAWENAQARGIIPKNAKAPDSWPKRAEYILPNYQTASPEMMKRAERDGPLIRVRSQSRMDVTMVHEDLAVIREEKVGKTQKEIDAAVSLETATYHATHEFYDQATKPKDQGGLGWSHADTMAVLQGANYWSGKPGEPGGRPVPVGTNGPNDTLQARVGTMFEGERVVTTDENGLTKFNGGKIKTPTYLGHEVHPDKPWPEGAKIQPGVASDPIITGVFLRAEKNSPITGEGVERLLPADARGTKAAGLKPDKAAATPESTSYAAIAKRYGLPANGSEEDKAFAKDLAKGGAIARAQLAAQGRGGSAGAKTDTAGKMPNLPGSTDYSERRDEPTHDALSRERIAMMDAGMTDSDVAVHRHNYPQRSVKAIDASAGKYRQLTELPDAKRLAAVEKSQGQIKARSETLAQERKRMMGPPYNFPEAEAVEFQRQHPQRVSGEIDQTFGAKPADNVEDFKSQTRSAMSEKIMAESTAELKKLDPGLNDADARLMAETLYKAHGGGVDPEKSLEGTLNARDKVADEIHYMSEGSAGDVRGKVAALKERASIAELDRLSKKIDETSGGDRAVKQFYGNAKTGFQNKKLLAAHLGIDLNSPSAIRGLADREDIGQQAADFAKGPGRESKDNQHMRTEVEQRLGKMADGTGWGDFQEPPFYKITDPKQRGPEEVAWAKQKYAWNREDGLERRKNEREDAKEKRDRADKEDEEVRQKAWTYAVDQLKHRWDLEREDRERAYNTLNTLLFQPLSQAFSGAIQLSGQALASTTQSAERQRETADSGIWRMLSPGGAA